MLELIDELQYSEEYAQFIMRTSPGDRVICNGDTLLQAMEDGYLFEEFLMEKGNQGMKSAEKVLQTINSIIAMFERYSNKSEYELRNLEQLYDARNEVQDLIEGKVEFGKMSWNAKGWFQEMPEWGTYGT